jgi:hypothetical protein
MLKGISRSGLISNTTPRSAAPRKMYNGGHTGPSNGRLMRTPKTPIGGVQWGTDVVCNDGYTSSPGCLYSDGNVVCGAACPSSSN